MIAVRTSLASTFHALGQVPLFGWVLGLLLVVGMVLTAREAMREHSIAGVAAPIALGIGAVLFAITIARVRFGMLETSVVASRYLHILAAMILPALAVAADRVARQWKVLLPVMVAAFLIGIPGNIEAVDKNIGPASRYRNYEQVITSLPRMRMANSLPRSFHPTLPFAMEVTVGWLLSGAKSGRIPAAGPMTPSESARIALLLSLQQQVATQPSSGCTFPSAPTRVHLAKGGRIGVGGSVNVVLLGPTGAPVSRPLTYGKLLLDPAPYHTLRAISTALDLRVSPASYPVALCR